MSCYFYLGMNISGDRLGVGQKYEGWFSPCFQLSEQRGGEICNACVLLVKRFRKLPTGHSQHWAHVVDARQPLHITRSPKFPNVQLNPPLWLKLIEQNACLFGI